MARKCQQIQRMLEEIREWPKRSSSSVRIEGEAFDSESY